MPIRRVFSPMLSQSVHVITLYQDSHVQSGTAAGLVTLATYTFTVDDLKNNRYQIKEILIDATIQNGHKNDPGTVQLALNGVAFGLYGATENTYDIYSWEIPITDYGQTLTIDIKAWSGAATANLKNLTIQGRVLSYS